VYPFFRFHLSVIYVIFFFLCLTSLSMIISSCICVNVNDIISSFLWLSSIPLYICTTSLSIPYLYLLPYWTLRPLSCLGYYNSALSCIGEGNGNPLQCSCLENPRGRGAWLAAVYGVAQSRTRLKQLSSSSSRQRLVNSGSSRASHREKDKYHMTSLLCET